MATPDRSDPGEDERGAVVDIAAIEGGRDRTTAALERLVRAGAEAQAELALLRAQQQGPPHPRPVPRLRPVPPPAFPPPSSSSTGRSPAAAPAPGPAAAPAPIAPPAPPAPPVAAGPSPSGARPAV